MARSSFGEISRKSDPAYWTPQLSKAREELLKRNLDIAGKLYGKVANELTKVKPRSLNDEILITKTEAQLGIWAVGYCKKSDERAGYRRILAGVPTMSRLWLFVANVFTLDFDTSPEALFAYQELLKCKPTEKYALVTLELLKKAEFSPAATDLLESIVRIIPTDLDTTAWFCRWALKSNHFEKAEEFSRKILDYSPDHAEANRCLGYLAEVRRNWAIASDHYQRSQDWLRLAVCSNHLGNHSVALMALMKVDQEKRKNSTWLYHAGWVYYQTGSFEKVREYWQELVAYSHHQEHQLLSPVLHQLDYKALNNLGNLKSTSLREFLGRIQI